MTGPGSVVKGAITKPGDPPRNASRKAEVAGRRLAAAADPGVERGRGVEKRGAEGRSGRRLLARVHGRKSNLVTLKKPREAASSLPADPRPDIHANTVIFVCFCVYFE